MLENVDVNSIKINHCMGAFPDSEMQSTKKEAILTHFVRMSQQKGQWVTEVVFREFLYGFKYLNVFESAQEFVSCIFALGREGYLEIDKENDILKVTEKFAELCRKYAV